MWNEVHQQPIRPAVPQTGSKNPPSVTLFTKLVSNQPERSCTPTPTVRMTEIEGQSQSLALMPLSLEIATFTRALPS